MTKFTMENKKMKTNVYTLPCKPGSVYIGFGEECLNDCRFCVKRFGKFFGYDLETKFSEKGIKKELKRIKDKCERPKEVVICGIGEPFLHYRNLIEIAKYCKDLFGKRIPLRADTTGLWWAGNKNLSFLEHITSLSISLNAESREKYNLICQPKINEAYDILMDFLNKLSEEKIKRKRFPNIRLTIVDTSRRELMPLRKSSDFEGECPIPNIRKCQEIADKFGFPLVVKQLFKDSKSCWDPKEIERVTLNGAYIEKCASCKNRHL